MKQIQTIELVNNSLISAIDKIHPEDGDTLVIKFRMNNEGDPVIDLQAAARVFNWIEDHIKMNYNNVKCIGTFDVFDIERAETTDG